jgi:hypothetical protein
LSTRLPAFRKAIVRGTLMTEALTNLASERSGLMTDATVAVDAGRTAI